MEPLNRELFKISDESGHTPERFLSVREVAARLGTTERFPRRLIEERRIEFVRFGRHIRIAESVLHSYINACTVVSAPRTRRFARFA